MENPSMNVCVPVGLLDVHLLVSHKDWLASYAQLLT